MLHSLICLFEASANSAICCCLVCPHLNGRASPASANADNCFTRHRHNQYDIRGKNVWAISHLAEHRHPLWVKAGSSRSFLRRPLLPQHETFGGTDRTASSARRGNRGYWRKEARDISLALADRRRPLRRSRMILVVSGENRLKGFFGPKFRRADVFQTGSVPI